MAGLRVFVNLFVENRSLRALPAEEEQLQRDELGAAPEPRIEAQDYIDAQHGPGRGWFRIVTSHEQARG